MKSNILESAKKYLKEHDPFFKEEEKTQRELMEEFILPGLYNSKNTLGSLYKFVPKQKSGIFGKLKNKFLHKMKNIVINVVERESMRQQKFNELTYQSIMNLQKQIDEIEKMISKKS
ncbi:MAG: hypothetical protein Kow0081_1610 [Candidatus Dojkabacteria bacterium]